MAFIVKYDNPPMESWRYEMNRPTEQDIQSLLSENYPGFYFSVMEI